LDAKDPEEWRQFFGQFGHVTAITIAYDNEELLGKLLERRKLISQLEDLLPPGKLVDPKNIAKAAEMAEEVSWYWKLYGVLDARRIRLRIAEIDEVIYNDLCQRDYDASEVFVVYETESFQQEALKHLQVPLWQVYLNNTSALQKKEYAFRGRKVLLAVEPPEPSSVRWPDLDETGFVSIVSNGIVGRTNTPYFHLTHLHVGLA
jgi:hypothetical protein